MSLGATHENDMGFDLTVDETLLQKMEEAALPHYPTLAEAKSSGERVGIRAYTSDFSPFFGEVPELSGVYSASGLGSSGLTRVLSWLPSSSTDSRQGVDLGPSKLPN